MSVRAREGVYKYVDRSTSTSSPTYHFITDRGIQLLLHHIEAQGTQKKAVEFIKDIQVEVNKHVGILDRSGIGRDRALMCDRPRSTDTVLAAGAVGRVAFARDIELESNKVARTLHRAILAAETIHAKVRRPALGVRADLALIVPQLNDPLAKIVRSESAGLQTPHVSIVFFVTDMSEKSGSEISCQ